MPETVPKPIDCRTGDVLGDDGQGEMAAAFGAEHTDEAKVYNALKGDFDHEEREPFHLRVRHTHSAINLVVSVLGPICTILN